MEQQREGGGTGSPVVPHTETILLSLFPLYESQGVIHLPPEDSAGEPGGGKRVIWLANFKLQEKGSSGTRATAVQQCSRKLAIKNRVAVLMFHYPQV